MKKLLILLLFSGILKAQSIPGAEDFQGQGIQRSLTAAYEELTMGS